MKQLLAARLYFVVDFLCFVLFSLGMLLFAVSGTSYKRGFFCNDESIKKPYKDSTVPTAVAIAVATAISVVVVFLNEYLLHKRKSNHLPLSNTDEEAPENCSKIPNFLKTSLYVVFVELYGAVFTGFLTDVGKYSLGRLRPHFLDVCKPAWDKFNCTDDLGRYLFVVEDVCTGTHAKRVKDMRLSFPSGHASFASYMMVFLVLYIEAKVHLPKESKFLKLLIQAGLILLALYTGFSRVSDYKHHWSDVLGGFFIGTTIAFVMIFRVLKPRFTRAESNRSGDSCVVNLAEHDIRIMETEREDDNEGAQKSS